MMSAAVTGPIPSIVSRSAWSADPRLIGPSSAAALVRLPHPPRRHDHLLAVGEPRGEVDRVRLGAAARAAGALDRVGDARAGRHPVDARLDHRPGDVDDDVAVGRRSAAADRLGGQRRATAGVPAGPALAHRPDPEQQQRHADRGEDCELEPAHSHAPILQAAAARVARPVSSSVTRR